MSFDKLGNHIYVITKNKVIHPDFHSVLVMTRNLTSNKIIISIHPDNANDACIMHILLVLHSLWLFFLSIMVNM